MDNDLKFVLHALRLAIHEAEGWYDEARGAEPDGKVPDLHYCYEQLARYGEKTLREQLAEIASN